MAEFSPTISARAFATRIAVSTLACGLSAFAAQAQDPAAIITASIASYDCVCACPYLVKKNGAKCGKSSAYSKTGGADLFCFAADLDAEASPLDKDTPECALARAVPTDGNIQDCTGEPI